MFQLSHLVQPQLSDSGVMMPAEAAQLDMAWWELAGPEQPEWRMGDGQRVLHDLWSMDPPGTPC